ncbi:MAG: ABC transporter permease [Spirochaetia bacterium]|nr:ABC transporter permease [Spirochaetia bacterium]
MNLRLDGIKYIFLREIRNYFNTPIGYVFGVSCLFFNFLFFFLGIFDIVPAFFEAKEASIRSYMNLLPVTFILMVPAISMRIWAEERKAGTIEVLRTLPLSDLALVTAKFLAAWAFVSGLIFASLPLAAAVFFLGNMDVGTTVALYIGSVLMAGAYVSLGMVISVITKEQIVAFILIFFASLFIFLSNYYIISQHLSPGMARVVGFFSHSYHFTSFSRGLLDTGDIFYYISFIALMITINVWVLRRER